MAKSIVVVFLLIIFCKICIAQSYLPFHKKKFKEVRYEIGDVISFRLKNDKSKVTAQIKSFEDSVIVFRNYKINPNEISHIYVDKKTKVWFFMRYKYQRLLPMAGAGYFLLDVINTGEISKETAIISGSLISIGLLAKWLIPDSLKIKGKMKLAIITN